MIEVGVNLAFDAASDETILQTLLWLFIPYDVVQEQKWMELGQKLIEELYQHLRAEFAGFRIVDGWLEFYFYAQSAKRFEPIVASLLTPQYSYEIGSYKDVKKTFYFDELYPNIKQLLQIHNNEIIAQLREAGDQCEHDREVEHYLFFPTQSNAQRALEKVYSLGFTCKQEYINDDNELRYTIIVTKSHNVKESVIHATTEDLCDIAMLEHGSYEGWSTILVEKNSL